VRQRRAAASEALAAYRAAVLGAIEDVDNALASERAASARIVLFRTQVEAAGAAALLARENYRAGLIDFQRLLDTETTLLNARDTLASAQSNAAQAVVQLYLALGGGWSPPEEGREDDRRL
jgi:outer membrane protein TolC